MRAVVYDRVSEADPASQAEHLRRCRAFAEARGWEVVAEHVDTASGYSRSARRPGWERVQTMVEQGEVDAVVVFAVSRAGRNLARFAAFVELCRDRGVTFTSATEPIDTAGPFGGAILALLSALAELESGMKRERALLGRTVAARDGRWSGGRRPFGWRVEDGKLVPDPAEAALVREGVTAVLNGATLRSIARAWNDRGYRTTMRARPWSPSGVRTTLAGAYHVPDVVTGSDHRRLLALLDSRATGRTPERYKLSGLVYCAEHGTHMTGRAGAYVCVHGGAAGRSLHLSASAPRLDLHVADAVAAREAAQPFAPVEARDPSDDLVRERERIVGELESLGESELSEHVLRGRERKLVRELERVEAKLDRPARKGGSDFWSGFVLDDVLVRRHVARVDIAPGRSSRFDPERVRITWAPR